MKVSKKCLNNILALSPFIILTFLIFFNYESAKNKWSNEKLIKRYTVGEVEIYENLGRGGPPRFKYLFITENQEYNDWLSLSKRIGFKNEKHTNHNKIIPEIIKLSIPELEDYVGKRFYVKFIVNYPQYSELLLDKPVPDSIKEIPMEGWDVIPGE